MYLPLPGFCTSYCVLFAVLLLYGRPTKIKVNTITWKIAVMNMTILCLVRYTKTEGVLQYRLIK